MIWPAWVGAAELTLTVPDHLQLGTGQGAEILVSGPADLSEVVLTVSAGTVLEAHRASPGQFVAQFLPPQQAFPAIALIAAVGTTGGAPIAGWARLPLWGTAEAVLQSVPGAELSLRIADRLYGPVRTDARGRGTVSVSIPPGVRKGFYGAQVLEFGLPRVPLIHVALEQPVARADRAQEIGVRLYTATEAGLPQPTFSPIARPAAGALTPFQRVAPGVLSAQWTVPRGEPREVELTVWSKGDPSERSTVKLRLIAGPAARVLFAIEPAVHQAGDHGKVRLVAHVLDAENYPTVGEPEFSTTVGVVGRAEPELPGAWTANLLVPDNFAGASEAVVTARVAEAPVATARLVLVPGAAATIRVEPARLTLVGDGNQRGQVQAELLDGHGNRRPDPIRFETASGDVESVSDAPPRTVRFTYRPQRSPRGGSAGVEIAAGGLTTHLEVELAPPPSRLSSTLRGGFFTNFGNANGPLLTADVTAWPLANLGVGLEASYLFLWRDSQVSTGPLASRRALLRLHGAPVLATVSWRATLARQLRFHAGAGGGVALLGSTLGVQGLAPVSELVLAPAARLSVGFGLALKNGEPFAQLEAGWIGAPPGGNFGPALVTGGLAIGYRVDLL